MKATGELKKKIFSLDIGYALNESIVALKVGISRIFHVFYSYSIDNGKVATAWLNWQLKGDKKSKTLFTGKTPALGKIPGWVVNKKNMQ